MLLGHVGDRIGRRTALVVSVLIMAGATVAVGALPTYHAIGAWAPALLLLCRLLQGFSVGGEYVGADIELCDAAERRLWACLSVFVGGFDLDGAAAVAGAVGSGVRETADVLDRLVAKSIVHREERGGLGWYRLLETLRDYGRDSRARVATWFAARKRNMKFAGK